MARVSSTLVQTPHYGFNVDRCWSSSHHNFLAISNSTSCQPSPNSFPSALPVQTQSATFAFRTGVIDTHAPCASICFCCSDTAAPSLRAPAALACPSTPTLTLELALADFRPHPVLTVSLFPLPTRSPQTQSTSFSFRPGFIDRHPAPAPPRSLSPPLLHSHNVAIIARITLHRSPAKRVRAFQVALSLSLSSTPRPCLIIIIRKSPFMPCSQSPSPCQKHKN